LTLLHQVEPVLGQAKLFQVGSGSPRCQPHVERRQLVVADAGGKLVVAIPKFAIIGN
jgi:hypothetical protein